MQMCLLVHMSMQTRIVVVSWERTPCR